MPCLGSRAYWVGPRFRSLSRPGPRFRSFTDLPILGPARYMYDYDMRQESTRYNYNKQSKHTNLGGSSEEKEDVSVISVRLLLVDTSTTYNK